MNKEHEILLNSTHDGMIAVDANGVITLFNRAAERIFGLSSSAVIGRRAVEVIPNTRLPIVLSSGQEELNQQQHIGSTVIITNRVPLRDESGRVVGAAAVFRDVSELQSLAAQVTD